MSYYESKAYFNKSKNIERIADALERLINIEEEKLKLYKETLGQENKSMSTIEGDIRIIRNHIINEVSKDSYLKELRKVKNDLEQKDIIKRAQIAESKRRMEEELKEKKDGTIL